MKSKLAVASLAAMMAVGAQAEESMQKKGFLGVNYSLATVDLGSGVPEFEPSLVYFRMGGHLNEYIAVEGRAGFGVQDDSISGNGAEVAIEIQRLMGVYVRAGLPNPTPIYPYAILGYTGLKSEINASSGSSSLSMSGNDDDVSYGLGANLIINENIDANAEYLVLYEDSDVEISSFNVGLTFKF